MSLILIRWPFAKKVHIITDAGFGTFDLMAEVKQWGGAYTSSMNSSHAATLWEAIRYNVAPQHWRAVMKDSGLIASVHTIETEKNKLVHQQIVSTAYSATIVCPQPQPLTQQQIQVNPNGPSMYYIII
jgi:hypothetical protein